MNRQLCTGGAPEVVLLRRTIGSVICPVVSQPVVAKNDGICGAGDLNVSGQQREPLQADEETQVGAADEIGTWPGIGRASRLPVPE